MTEWQAQQPRLFGRRLGRPLRVRKTALLETLLPRLQLTLPERGFAEPKSWFATPPRDIWLEIGFGGGEHLAAQAAQNPNIGFIGCEPFRNGVASLLDHIDRQGLGNIRIQPDDARPLLAALLPASLARVFILFADPWPKKRHAERRFVQQATLGALARVMQPDARLRLATDDPVLQEWTTVQMRATPLFVPEFGDGISTQRPADWVVTRYEEKALQARRTPLYYCFKKG